MSSFSFEVLAVGSHGLLISLIRTTGRAEACDFAVLSFYTPPSLICLL